ncbi:protein of unknown function [Pseudomonas marincola]|uniref:Uncharacterized protein n=1 Tax=Pseudomonas marincola TaxID=437900 RepID=A0A8S2BE23_9PSED|nr:protein of unknown function [Pseudomonas marincola]
MALLQHQGLNRSLHKPLLSLAKLAVKPQQQPFLWRYPLHLRQCNPLRWLIAYSLKHIGTHLHTPLLAVRADHNGSFQLANCSRAGNCD